VHDTLETLAVIGLHELGQLLDLSSVREIAGVPVSLVAGGNEVRRAFVNVFLAAIHEDEWLSRARESPSDRFTDLTAAADTGE
jgi:hypothetical protein